MYGIGLDYASCACSEIFSRDREPEVEGDDSRVVVAVGNKKLRFILKGGAEGGESQ